MLFPGRSSSEELARGVITGAGGRLRRGAHQELSLPDQLLTRSFSPRTPPSILIQLLTVYAFHRSIGTCVDVRLSVAVCSVCVSRALHSSAHIAPWFLVCPCDSRTSRTPYIY